jgi:hypothetical protein
MNLSATLDNRTVVTEVKGKGQAQEEYKSAISQGNTAVKAERKKLEESLKVNLGNLAP